MEKYEKYLITDSTSKNAQIIKMVERTTNEKMKKVDTRMRIVFHLKKPIDEQEFSNFNRIDGTISMLEKMYPSAVVRHDWDKFIVEEL
jgi:hypothetical protein